MLGTVRPATAHETATELAVYEWRTCKDCLDRLPLDVSHFQITYRRKTDGVVRYRKICRHCEVQIARRRDRELRANPETRDAYLARRRKVSTNYAERHPEKAEAFREKERKRRKSPEVIAGINARRRQRYADNREEVRARGREDYHRNREKRKQQLRESYARRKADPVRWQRYRDFQREYRDKNRERINENRRIWTRLKAEREGRSVRQQNNRPPERFPSLPVAPINPIITRLVEAYGMPDVAMMTQLSDRVLARIVSNEPESVIGFDTGDQLCCALGYNLWEFWPEYA